MLGATIMDDCDGTADVVLEERHRNLCMDTSTSPNKHCQRPCTASLSYHSPHRYTERWTVAAGMAKLIIDRRYTLMCGLRIHNARDKSCGSPNNHNSPLATLRTVLQSYQNLPNTLERPGAPRSMPTPSCIATLTGRMGAESKTCGHGCGSGEGVSRGCSSSRSYIDGCRGP